MYHPKASEILPWIQASSVLDKRQSIQSPWLIRLSKKQRSAFRLCILAILKGIFEVCCMTFGCSKICWSRKCVWRTVNQLL
jgi:hypothetical protein